MKRYSLPPGIKPGDIPVPLIRDGDVNLVHAYTVLHGAAVLHGLVGPLTAAEWLAPFPRRGDLDPAAFGEQLQRLAELGYLEVQMLA